MQANCSGVACSHRVETNTSGLKPQRLLAVVSFTGYGYYGFQYQKGYQTIEGELVTAMVKAGVLACDGPQALRRVHWSRCARTDRGVSAAANVLSFDTAAPIDGLADSINRHLPPQVRVLHVQPAPRPDFDARRDCCWRRYEYLLPLFALDPQVARPRGGCSEAQPPQPPLPLSLHVEASDAPCGADHKQVSGMAGRRQGQQQEQGQQPQQQLGNEAQGEQQQQQWSPAHQESLQQPALVSSTCHHRPQQQLGQQQRTYGHHQHAVSHRSAIEAASSTYQLTPSEQDRLDAILGMFVGRHSFHNFTSDKEALSDGCSKHGAVREVLMVKCDGVVTLLGSCSCSSGQGADGASSSGCSSDRGGGGGGTSASGTCCGDPVAHNGSCSQAACSADRPIPCARITLVGSSFMMHQIRKMVGLAVAVARGAAPASAIPAALRPDVHATVPTSPAAGLVMMEAGYVPFGDHQVEDQQNAAASSRCIWEQAAAEFTQQRIHPSIHASRCLEQAWGFAASLASLDFNWMLREGRACGASEGGKGASNGTPSASACLRLKPRSQSKDASAAIIGALERYGRSK